MTMAASRAPILKKQLYEDFKDPVYASAYINEAILDGDEAVLKTALGDVIRTKGVAAVTRKAGINRVTVYKTLKPDTESSFTTMHASLKACDVGLQVQPAKSSKAKRASTEKGASSYVATSGTFSAEPTRAFRGRRSRPT